VKLPRWLSGLFEGSAATPDDGAADGRRGRVGDGRRGGLALVGRPQGEAEAELWRDILGQWGVTCLVKNVSALAYTSTGDMFEVWVREEDEEYARELLGLGEGDGGGDLGPDEEGYPADNP
jgi:hypothetical protein